MIVVQTVVEGRIRVEAKYFQYKYRLSVPLLPRYHSSQHPLNQRHKKLLCSTLRQLPHRQAKSSMQFIAVLVAALSVAAVSAGVIEERSSNCGGKKYETDDA